jgi:lipopolysaccharide export system permease protein
MDDIIGKGMTFWMLTKFFAYSFVTFIPVAMPLAVLLSSIMTFGNLAENYELAAMKSSGLSLFKILRPLFGFIVFLAGLTFVFNNFVLPSITLKSAQMLWDIRQAKPTLSIKEGIYYNQLKGYSIKTVKKNKDGKTLYNLSIYDHHEGRGNNIQLYADSGSMQPSADTNYLQIRLNDGVRYDDNVKEEDQKTSRPLTQLFFKQLNVNVDMSEFKMKNTAEDLFKGHHEMMDVWQIDDQLDTFDLEIFTKYRYLKNQFDNYFFTRTYHTASMKVKHLNLKAFYASLNRDDFRRSVENAQNLVRNSSGFIDSVNEEVAGKRYQKTDWQLGWHKKINISFACIVLFFVGASLGAIIRKGGMGLPVVVAVLFFLLYYIVNIIYERMVDEGIYNVVFGAWFPLCLFLPLGIFLTYKAAKDSALFDINQYLAPVKNFFNRFKKAKHADPPAQQ